MVDAAGLDVDTVRTGAGLLDLRPEWEALYGRTATAVPFVSHAWMVRCWDRHREQRRHRLNIVVVRRSGRVVLIAPLLARRNLFGLTTLSWLDSMTPCYGGLLAEESADGVAATALLARRLTESPGIARTRLNTVLEDAAAQAVIRQVRSRVRSSTIIHRLVLSDYAGWDDLVQRMSYNSRAKLRRNRRLIAQMGPVAFEPVLAADEVADEVTTIFRRKRAHFAARGIWTDWLNAPATERLFRNAAIDGLASGESTIYRLRVAEQTMASIQTFRHGRRLYLSKMAYDPAAAKLSPGTACRWFLVEQAFADGMTSIDFMTGEHDWKEREANREIACTDRRIPGRLPRLFGLG